MLVDVYLDPTSQVFPGDKCGDRSVQHLTSAFKTTEFLECPGREGSCPMFYPKDPWNLLRKGRTLYNKGLGPLKTSQNNCF